MRKGLCVTRVRSIDSIFEALILIYTYFPLGRASRLVRRVGL